MKVNTDAKAKGVFDKYPKHIQPKLLKLRTLIIETAKEFEEIQTIEETLKWGEPSYLSKKGSTVRIDWKESKPKQYAMYFKCTSKLVPTFKVLYEDVFAFEKNRAIIFELNQEIPTKELKHCIGLALCYHNLKHLPNLGAILSK